MRNEAFYNFCVSDGAPAEVYTLSLHDALLISVITNERVVRDPAAAAPAAALAGVPTAQRLARALGDKYEVRRLVGDRKSTRLNSSHVKISYADFCLKKKTMSANSPLDPTPRID